MFHHLGHYLRGLCRDPRQTQFCAPAGLVADFINVIGQQRKLRTALLGIHAMSARGSLSELKRTCPRHR